APRCVDSLPFRRREPSSSAFGWPAAATAPAWQMPLKYRLRRRVVDAVGVLAALRRVPRPSWRQAG
ncbi:sodium transporter, partial [Xanthomonas perforans]